MNSIGRAKALSNIAGSIFVTALTIAAIEICSRFVVQFPSPAPVLLMAVVYSAFAGGMPAGLLSAALSIAYGAYAFANRNPPPAYTDLGTARLLTLSATAPTLAILTGLLQLRARRATEKSMHRQSEERFRQALVNAPIPIMMHTDEGQVLLLSDEWTRQSGYTLVDIPKLSDWLRAAHGDQADAIARSVGKLFDLPRGAPEMDFSIRTKCGEQRVWAFTISAPGMLPDGRRYLVVMARDTTASNRAKAELLEASERTRLAKEQAESANKAKDKFLAALSHELRTPLTPVLLTAAALEIDPQLPPELRADMSLIRRNIELEGRLIDDLLDLTRVSRGKLKLDLHAIDPVRAVRGAIEVCQDDVQAKDITLTLAPPPEPMCVRGDSARLQQVFWNLIKNAVKFTPPGGMITIQCDRAGDRLSVRVTDSGVGIEPDLLPRIFNAFEQGNEQVGRQFGGLGLGLAISKTVTEMHGGTLRAESDGKDHGATFTVDLPLIPAPAERGEGASPHGQTACRPLRILLVEDHDPTSRVLSLLLRQMHHEVTAAPTVKDALRCVENHPFDLLISDLGLPDGTGLELMREIRRTHNITGICLSGYGMDQDIIETREAGFVEHLIKPVDLLRLKSAIESVTA